MARSELVELAGNVEKEMKHAAKNLEFERAAELRDMLAELRQRIAEAKPDGKAISRRKKRD